MQHCLSEHARVGAGKTSCQATAASAGNSFARQINRAPSPLILGGAGTRFTILWCTMPLQQHQPITVVLEELKVLCGWVSVWKDRRMEPPWQLRAPLDHQC